jgi:hypothetical protein
MADTEHTPGPWHRDADGFISSAKETIADPRCSSLDIDEREANATLIATAPAILTALIGLKNCAASMDNRHHAHTPLTARNWSDLHAAVNTARAVIAAATKINADV